MRLPTALALFTLVWGLAHAAFSLSRFITDYGELLDPPKPPQYWWGMAVIALISVSWIWISYFLFLRRRWACRVVAGTAIVFGLTQAGLSWDVHFYPFLFIVVRLCIYTVPMVVLAIVLSHPKVLILFNDGTKLIQRI
ncbi:MAG: hypothetical protein QOH01_2891 [Verrucomicrobiota bacterium]